MHPTASVKFLRRFAFPLLTLAAALSLRSQDVTVSAPQWASPSPQPETLPADAGFKPEFPRELRKTDEISYVNLKISVDADGTKLTRDARGSNAVVERAVMDSLGRWWKIAPARLGGQPVTSRYEITVIFNPGSAAADGPNASPRLLAAPPCNLAPRLFQHLSGTLTYRAHISVDSSGNVTDVTSNVPDAEEAAHLAEGIKQWKFAPARVQGVATAATVEMSVVPTPNAWSAVSGIIPPKPTKEEPALYPPAMVHTHMRGEVTVAFTVATNGWVRDATVVSSNNPGFEDAALKAIRQWRFRPATRDGKPLSYRLKVPFTFQFDSMNHGNESYGIQSGGNHRLPAEYQYDVAPQIEGAVLPAYPFELLDAGERGHASVTMLVSAAGRVIGVRLDSATKPEFGEALAAAAAMYQFHPAIRAGKPTATLVGLQKDFDLHMALPLGTSRIALDDADLVHSVAKHPDRVTPANRLDTPLRPTSRRIPNYPPQLFGPKAANGSATIEILIDDQGRARSPRVVSATQPEFGYAAAQAALYWTFDPPKSGGKTVTTKVQIPFNFTQPK